MYHYITVSLSTHHRTRSCSLRKVVLRILRISPGSGWAESGTRGGLVAIKVVVNSD